ncbi:hypothetical protein [Streptomyces sp. NPDC046371]|uniref:hypothetical protein n=1 Tax=Streptomyces sp. NPDC046371 TaxID=3154916 RepID=UPI0033DDC702
MSTETREQNRHSRALEAAIGRESEFDYRLLVEHRPAPGSAPVCLADNCGEPWPCGRAEGAMRMVGVRA